MTLETNFVSAVGSISLPMDALGTYTYAEAGLNTYYMTGNDINELYAPHTSLERYSRFWVLSNRFLSQVKLQ